MAPASLFHALILLSVLSGVVYSDQPRCSDLAANVNSQVNYTANCMEDGGSGEELMDGGIDSDPVCSMPEVMVMDNNLVSVKNCSGQYNLSCANSSGNKTICVNLCIVDIQASVSNNSIVCKLNLGWDYCLQENISLLSLGSPEPLEELHNSSGVYYYTSGPLLFPGNYTCSTTLFNEMFNSTPVIKSPLPVVSITTGECDNNNNNNGVMAGNMITLRCCASPSTELNIRTIRMLILSNGSIVHDEITINNVTTRDSGVYTCKVQFISEDPLVIDSEIISATLNLTVTAREGPSVGSAVSVNILVGAVVGGVGGSLLLLLLLLLLCFVISRRSVGKRTKYYSSERPITYTNSALAVPLVEEAVGMSADPINGKENMELEKIEDTGRKGIVVSIEAFSRHVKTLHEDANHGFEDEFKSLPMTCPSSYVAAKLPSNLLKNRFENIFPYDFCRVKLQSRDSSDYINASFLHGYNKPDAYIAAQGPLSSTVDDFWQMVWEYKLPTIVMLTDVVEAGRSKCEQYWPTAVGQSMELSDSSLKVTLSDQRPYAEYQVKNLLVTSTSTPDDPPLKVTHYHFTAWPDHGVPADKTSLIQFIQRTRKCHPYSNTDPLLVHCSAGVGRTGTFMLLDSMLQRMKSEETLDIYDFLVEMRARRPLMVQTEAQYIFIHDALEEFITCGDTAIATINLRIAIGKLSRSVDQTTGYERQFGLLEEVSHKPNLMNCTDGKAEHNRAKNRYPKILPFNTNRVLLKSKGVKGSDYINASFIDGYKQRRAYIATQGPLEDTLADFWRMIWEHQSRVIVMLCSLTENSTECCQRYWPETLGEEQLFGKFKVKLTSESPCGDFTMRRLDVSEEGSTMSTGAGNSRTVTQFQHLDWPERGQPPQSRSVLRMADGIIKTQIGTGNHTITVLCNDGVGRTGTFICVCSQLERIKVESMADVFQYIKGSRIQRAGLVANVEQYQFCHAVLAEYIDSFEKMQYDNFK